MAIAYMLGWWYGQGWGWLLRNMTASLKRIEENFSVPILLKTWFSPWKQIQTPSSLHHFFQSLIDNSISRLIGAIVRTFVLLTAFILTFVVLFGGLAMLILWPFFPLLIFILPVAALVV
ncbi:MAG TPA: hypothetical protein VFW77_00940 [Candidatus Saccharimonadales bacterium]|nr:hypothetical protein [Candidatus Saccharimonadales bacterium]